MSVGTFSAPDLLSISEGDAGYLPLDPFQKYDFAFLCEHKHSDT